MVCANPFVVYPPDWIGSAFQAPCTVSDRTRSVFVSVVPCEAEPLKRSRSGEVNVAIQNGCTDRLKYHSRCSYLQYHHDRPMFDGIRQPVPDRSICFSNRNSCLVMS